jgi:hypothetical protein
VNDPKLVNLFMLIKFFLPRLPAGHIVEFGSFRGGSAIFMAVVANELCPGTKVFGFDSFAGMPPTDGQRDIHNAGDFSAVSVDEVRQFAADAGVHNLELVEGMFEDTVPTVLPSIGPLRLSHIDCDLFDAIALSYDGSKAQLVPGGYMVFDDPLEATCLGGLEAIESLVIRRLACRAGVPASGLSRPLNHTRFVAPAKPPTHRQRAILVDRQPTDLANHRFTLLAGSGSGRPGIWAPGLCAPPGRRPAA